MAYIWGVSLAAALGGLLFGYDWVVIGGAKPFYERFFHLTAASHIGWAMSSALVGCLVGALVSGGLSDRFGRKRLLILSAFLFMVSSIGTGMSDTFTVFVLWRILGGVAIGMASNLSPMYIAEVSPARLRGMLVSVNQLTIVVGILAAQVVNWRIADSVPAGATQEDILNSWNGQIGWRWMFGATALPAFIFFLLMFAVPESPRWLAKNGRNRKARNILTRIGGADYADQAIAEIDATLVNDVGKVPFQSLVKPGMVRILLIGVALAVFQQWCGINVIFNYAEEVFSAAGYNVSQILLNIVITGAVNLLATFVAICTVDRLGRRFLMLAGSAGLAITYSLIGASYHLHSTGIHVLLLVLLAIACYAFSLAPVTWVILSEIFPNRIRGAAMAISVFALWSGCFTLTYSFPFLNRNLGAANTFWIYAVICVGGFFFINSHLPETKGKTLESIERQLVD
ncbi:MAG TPA: sugar porter family MFS transporter [Acidobacteriota bacterium]|nr:sugar porter family MFS transporter [Acidobacteriota bacterium]